jgi:hypothetical protein
MSENVTALESFAASRLQGFKKEKKRMINTCAKYIKSQLLTIINNKSIITAIDLLLLEF